MPAVLPVLADRYDEGAAQRVVAQALRAKAHVLPPHAPRTGVTLKTSIEISSRLNAHATPCDHSADKVHMMPFWAEQHNFVGIS